MGSSYTWYKVTHFLHHRFLNDLGSVWYMCLKTKNYCLKIFVEIRVGEKVRWNAWNVV